ncbi:NACHT domain-containing protein [Massilia sp. IC2-477]|uniref:NACHT domain-containing protein n=1 Tax=Massilia sp. IC2-477 TaxID=2887198 RepID=UPI001D114BCA|nr:NACHT domain-containing protein [Massilia sp. IC2-477]MCC2956434.1 NACHT domain-containing protein [Massilia sp. IC2-477]
MEKIKKMPNKHNGKNVPLSRAKASNAFNRIRDKIPQKVLALINELTAKMDEDGSVLVQVVHETLFPLADTTSANAQLEKLLNTIETAAQQNSLNIKAAFRGGRNKNIANQRLYFVGVQPDLKADVEGLRAIEPSRLIPGQVGQVVVGARNVVLVTFNDYEYAAIRKTFWQNEGEPVVRRDEGVAVDDLGLHGGLTVLHYHCHHQGNHASQRAVSDVYRAYSPAAVIAVGIAFGVDETNQSLGQVLVSNFICNYELAKVHRNGLVSFRGARPPGSRALIKALHHLDQRYQNSITGAFWPQVRFGGLLSGEKLVDNIDYRESLKKEVGQDDIIGGEMEAVGVHAALDGHPVDWVVVKAICDWADGNKSKNKKRQQQDAAANAAQVVKALLADGGLYNEGDAKNKTSSRPDGVSQSKVRASRSLSHRQMLLDSKGLPHWVERQTALPFNLDSISEPPDAWNTERTEAAPTVVAFDDIISWVQDPQGRPLYALLGDYGMGKTITCQRIAQALHERRERGEQLPAPLYFDLRKVERVVAASSNSPGHVPTLQESIEDCLRHGYLHEGGESPRYEEVLRTIDQGAVVIFDGLDEVLSRIGEKQGLSFTANLLKILPEARARSTNQNPNEQVRVLLTCRTQFFRNFAEQNDHLVGNHRGASPAQQYRALLLQPFRDDDIRAYLQAVIPSEDPERLMQLVESVHNLRELAARPFTLKLVAQFIPRIEQWRTEGRQITGATLYREVAREWLIRDKEKQSFQPEDKERLAGDLAAHLWKISRRGLRAHDLELWLGQWLADQGPHADFQRLPRDLLQEDLRNSTFLKRHDGQKPEDSRFEFAHSSLQEFFLADYLLRALKSQSNIGIEARNLWAMPLVSDETLDFLGQMLMEDSTAEPSPAAGKSALAILSTWRTPYLKYASEMQLSYALRAYRKGWPMQSVVGMDLRSADLSDWHFGVLDEAILDSAQARPRFNMNRAKFSNARLRRARFWHVSLEGAQLNDVVATQIEFLNCRAEKASWLNADLKGSVFRNTSIEKDVPPDMSSRKQEQVLPQYWTGAQLMGAHFLQCPVTPDGMDASRSRFIGERPGGPGTLTLSQGHVNWTSCCAISPDGLTLVSGAGDNTLRLWNSQTGERLLLLHGHHAPVNCCGFTPDSSLIISGSRDGTLRIWNVKTGKCTRILSGHNASIEACVISPDGNLLISSSMDSTLRIWELASGKCLSHLGDGLYPIASCAFSPDGAHFATGGVDHKLAIWNLASGKIVRDFVGHTEAVTCCSFSSDGRMLLSGSIDCTVRIWDAASAECLNILDSHVASITSLAISPDDKLVISGSDDGFLQVWDTTTCEYVGVFIGHDDGVDDCSFSSDGSKIISIGDNTLKLWDTGSGECLLEMGGRIDWVNSCGVSQDGRRLIAASHEALRVWDIFSEAPPRLLQGHHASASTCAISADGRKLASGSYDQTIRIWDGESGQCLHILTIESAHTEHCEFAYDGHRLITGSFNGTLQLWDTSSGNCLRIFTIPDEKLLSCAISPCGSFVMAGGTNGTLTVCEANTGVVLHKLEGHENGIAACAFSADSTYLISGGHDSDLRLWDLQSGKCLATLSGHTSAVKSCATSADGRRLVSASWDDSIRVWDLVSRECIRVIWGHESGVISCDISADGRRIVTGSWDGSVRVWDTDSGECQCVLVGDAQGAVGWVPNEHKILHLQGNAWRHVVWQPTQ